MCPVFGLLLWRTSGAPLQDKELRSPHLINDVEKPGGFCVLSSLKTAGQVLQLRSDMRLCHVCPRQTTEGNIS